MKINLAEIDKESFMVHESTIYGEPLYLVQPQHIGCKWTQENKIFRSSVWDKEGNPVSLGFKKFVNWGENVEQFPTPISLKNTVATEKIDGSLICVSKWRGHLIVRTRGTFDAFAHDNGNELASIVPKLRDIFQFDALPNGTAEGTLLLEWVSPTNRIILNYGDKPDFYLVGLVNHEDYSLTTQEHLDDLAKRWDFKRPITHTFTSLEELISNVEEWKGKEGICLYSKGGQEIHKIKGTWYLQLHSLKSEISNAEKLVDVYLNWGMPEYEKFEKKIIDTFDFELFTQIRGDVSKICEAKKEAEKIIAHMKGLAQVMRDMTRKDAALSIIAKYGQTAKKGIMFGILDGKEIDQKGWKTLILQNL